MESRGKPGHGRTSHALIVTAGPAVRGYERRVCSQYFVTVKTFALPPGEAISHPKLTWASVEFALMRPCLISHLRAARMWVCPWVSRWWA